MIVPSLLGTRLVNGEGRLVWGATSNIFFGPAIGGAKGVRSAGLLEELPILPGVVGQDIHGGLMRYLEDVGGYRRGENLLSLDYDWRAGVAHGAARLGELLRSIRGAGTGRVDLAAISSGGAVVRYFLAYARTEGLIDPDSAEAARPLQKSPGAEWVRRVIYLGSPQRGTFGAAAHLHEGIDFIPGGKHVPPNEIALCQTTFDYLPHPDDPVFVDKKGNVLPLDIYDPETWIKLGLAGGLKNIDVADFEARLRRGRKLHAALDGGAGRHPDTIVIGARHLPTRARFLVSGGRAIIPDCYPRKTDPALAFTYVPGDGALPEASLRAVPGLDEDRLWFATPKAHHLIPADPGIHRLLLEALLATDRRPDPLPRQGAETPIVSGDRA
ncbi:MAG: hypothetical protein HUU21_20040 [Polyangiaceae bacterium]|nr:hypothetical protein [Polyangiaceae bacterium]